MADEQTPKATAEQVAAALAPTIIVGKDTAAAIAGELAGTDWSATPEDEAAAAIQAAVEKVTEGKGKTGGAAAGRGARIQHGHAILAARQLRAATS